MPVKHVPLHRAPQSPADDLDPVEALNAMRALMDPLRNAFTHTRLELLNNHGMLGDHYVVDLPPVTGAGETCARAMIAEALPNAPKAALHAVERLCGLVGAPSVAVVVTYVWVAKAGATKAQTTVSEDRRRHALDALDDAVRQAQERLYHANDAHLWKALGALLPLVRAAGHDATPKAQGGGRPRLGPGRAAMVQDFRDLGATTREAEMIVSAVRGVRAHHLPEPTDPS